VQFPQKIRRYTAAQAYSATARVVRQTKTYTVIPMDAALRWRPKLWAAMPAEKRKVHPDKCLSSGLMLMTCQ